MPDRPTPSASRMRPPMAAVVGPWPMATPAIASRNPNVNRPRASPAPVGGEKFVRVTSRLLRGAQVRTKEGHQRGGLERFAQITTRSDGTSAFGKHVVVGGDENDRRRNALGRQSLLKIESAQTAEVDIEHNALR